jgi:hypothetical protein
VKISIDISENIKVSAPYNTLFVSKAKKIGGKWNKPHWEFDIRDEDRVRALCMEIYGSDGLQSNLCTIRVLYDSSDVASQGPIEFHGRTVAAATSHNSGVKLGDGVVVITGGFTSNGSIKNWVTQAKKGTACLIRDVPRAIVEQMIKEGGDGISIESEITQIKTLPRPLPVEKRKTLPTIDREALEKEKNRLMWRISEIEMLLFKDNKKKTSSN